jgi:hypothetical protein
MGYPGAGKTSIVKEFPNYVRLNRDTLGGSIDQLAVKLNFFLSKDKTKSFVLDNTYPTILDNTYPTIISRHSVINIAKRHNVPVRCINLNTSIEDAQYNVCQRMLERYGKLLMPEEIKNKKDPNTFPVTVLFKYRKELESPSLAEGFTNIEVCKFIRRPQNTDYNNKAVIFDYDGTLRKTKSGNVYRSLKVRKI